MPGLSQSRGFIRRLTAASYERELLAACARRPAVSPGAHSALDAFDGLFAASLAATTFWVLLIVLLRCR
jgi:hypothetical protein